MSFNLELECFILRRNSCFFRQWRFSSLAHLLYALVQVFLYDANALREELFVIAPNAHSSHHDRIPRPFNLLTNPQRLFLKNIFLFQEFSMRSFSSSSRAFCVASFLRKPFSFAYSFEASSHLCCATVSASRSNSCSDTTSSICKSFFLNTLRKILLLLIEVFLLFNRFLLKFADITQCFIQLFVTLLLLWYG